MRNQCVKDAHTVMMVLFFFFGWLCDEKKEKQLLQVWPVKTAIDSEMGSVRWGTLSLIPLHSLRYPNAFFWRLLFFYPHQLFPLIVLFFFVCLFDAFKWFNHVWDALIAELPSSTAQFWRSPWNPAENKFHCSAPLIRMNSESQFWWLTSLTLILPPQPYVSRIDQACCVSICSFLFV